MLSVVRPVRPVPRSCALLLFVCLLAASTRLAADGPDAQEVAERWQKRRPVEPPARLRPSTARFHVGTLDILDPDPQNPLLDPLGLFGDETGEEPAVGTVPRLDLADFDGDGDLDAFVGDYYGRVRYFENVAAPGELAEYVERTGAASPTGSLDLTEPPGTSPYGPSAPTLIDIDGDDDLDLFVGQGPPSSPGGRVLFFENVDGTLVRNDVDNPLAGFIFGLTGATPRFADLDQDGDFDAFVGRKFENTTGVTLSYLENEGTAENPVFVDRTGEPGADPFAAVTFRAPTAVAFGDLLDDDGDLDVLVGSQGRIRTFRNDSLPAGPVVLTELTGYDNPFAGTVFDTAGPVLGDVDADGDLDVLLGGQGGGTAPGFVQYFENTGTASDPAFLSTGDRLELVDVDGDGDLDALASAYRPAMGATGPELDVFYFENVGSDSEPTWELRSGLDNPFFTFNTAYVLGPGPYELPSLAPTVGDLDGDGLLEAFVGRPDGFLEYLEDDGTGQLDPAASHPLEAVDFVSDVDPQLVDLDGDGELDLIVGSNDEEGYSYGSYLSVFFNPPGPEGLSQVPSGSTFLGDAERIAPTAADVDGDGDLDFFLGTAADADGNPGAILFLENLSPTPGGVVLEEDDGVRVELTLFAPTSPAFGDLDGDGVLDFVVGNPAGAEVFLSGVEDVEEPRTPSVLEIPTLSQWGAMLFGGLLALAGWLGIRKMGL